MSNQSSKNPKDVIQRILVSATKNFAKNGYAGASLKDIAESAKISKGGLYHHFASKEDLFIATFSRVNDLIWEKTMAYFAKKQQDPNAKEDNLFEGLSEYYDLVIIGAKDLERLWIEGIMESVHNPKLRRLLLKQERQNVLMGTEVLKQIRDSSTLLQGYTDEDLFELANGYSSFHRGIILDRLMGKNPKIIRAEWIKMIFAVYNSKK